MSHASLGPLLRDFRRNLSDASSLASAVQAASSASVSFSPGHVDLVVEMAFLHGYLAWESFLEEAFVLYLLGKSAPSGFKPASNLSPPNRKLAFDLLIGDGRRPPDWTAPSLVDARAKRCFRDGRPFSNALRSFWNRLSDMKKVRNRIAHMSSESQDDFEAVVKNELNYYPRGMTAGGFLSKVDLRGPRTRPQSILDAYFGHMLAASAVIVPE